MDDRLIQAMLLDYIDQQALDHPDETNFKRPEHYSIDLIEDLIATYPNQDVPQYFGLHQNSEIKFQNQQLKCLSK